MSNKKSKQNLQSLYELIANLQSAQDVQKFLEDLCTASELQAMSQRLQSAKLLLSGKTYTEVIEETGISSATLSRVSKCVKFGKGYKKFAK